MKASKDVQGIPEAFQELITEPGWWHHPDADLWIWRIQSCGDYLSVRVAREYGEWWVTCESDGSVFMDLGVLIALTSRMLRVYDALGLPDEGAFVALSELGRLAGWQRVRVRQAASEDQITPAWNPDDYDLVVEE